MNVLKITMTGTWLKYKRDGYIILHKIDNVLRTTARSCRTQRSSLGCSRPPPPTPSSW